jgi:hypothetical protein
MNNFEAAIPNNPLPPPRPETPALAQIDANRIPHQTTTPDGAVAISANWDTDFRKKLGIERWGWGLND